MARIKGVSPFPVNYEPGGQSPLDARLLVPTLSDLYSAYDDGNNYYPNMVVTVQAENAQYMLIDVTKRGSADGWMKMGVDSSVSTDLGNLTKYYTYRYPSTQDGVVIKAKLGSDEEITEVLNYHKNRDTGNIKFILAHDLVEYDESAVWKYQYGPDGCILKYSPSNDEIMIGYTIGGDDAYLRLKQNDLRLSINDGAFLKMIRDTNSGDVLNLQNETFNLRSDNSVIKLSDARHTIFETYKNGSFLQLNRLSHADDNDYTYNRAIVRYNIGYEENNLNEEGNPIKAPNYLAYFGYRGADFAECREGSNKITIPLDKFDETDAINKKYVDDNCVLVGNPVVTGNDINKYISIQSGDVTTESISSLVKIFDSQIVISDVERLNDSDGGIINSHTIIDYNSMGIYYDGSEYSPDCAIIGRTTPINNSPSTFLLELIHDLSKSVLLPGRFDIYFGDSTFGLKHLGCFTGTTLELGPEDIIDGATNVADDYRITMGKRGQNNKYAEINALGFRNVENSPNKVFTTDGNTTELPKYQIITQSEYDALTTKDEDKIYFIKSDNPVNLTFTE